MKIFLGLTSVNVKNKVRDILYHEIKKYVSILIKIKLKSSKHPLLEDPSYHIYAMTIFLRPKSVNVKNKVRQRL